MERLVSIIQLRSVRWDLDYDLVLMGLSTALHYFGLYSGFIKLELKKTTELEYMQ